MNKNTLKFIGILVIALVFIYAFSATYSPDSIDNISYVIALAVDESEGSNNLQVTFEFIDTSAFANEQGSESNGGIVDTVTATSINSALNLLNAYVGKSVNLSHCKVVVFSDKLAKKGITTEITELMNNIQVRPSTNIVICKGNALEYLQNSTSQLEKILTKYYDIFPNSSEYTGFTWNIMIGEFYNYLTTKECGNLAILGGLNPKISSASDKQSGSSESQSSGSNSESESSSNHSNDSSADSFNNNTPFSEMVAGNAPILGERGTENIGLAVLKEGVYKGDLTASDTLCHTLISGEVNSFLLTINNTELYKYYSDIFLFENTSPKISVDTSKDTPEITIKIVLVGRIDSIKNGINFSEESTKLNLDEISGAVSKSVEGYITKYLEKTTNDFKCDLDYFYTYAKRNFKTIQEWKDYNWDKKYEKSKFNVCVESHVYYSLLNTN